MIKILNFIVYFFFIYGIIGFFRATLNFFKKRKEENSLIKKEKESKIEDLPSKKEALEEIRKEDESPKIEIKSEGLNTNN